MTFRWHCTIAAVLTWACIGNVVLAEDNAGARTQLDKVLAVLRVRPDAAGKACLDAMHDVHTTEQQVKDHQNDSGAHSDLDIARDVLDSDYQTSTQICGADAAHACRGHVTASLTALCAALHTDIDSGLQLPQ